MSNDKNDNLPSGWVQTVLGEITYPSRPRHNPQNYPDLPFIGMEHIEAHTMKLLGTVPAGQMRSNAVHFFSGDVLYGRLRPYLNKVYGPGFEGLCSAEFIVLPGSEHIDSNFLRYFLNRSGFVSFASHLNEGDRPRVDFPQLAQHPILLSPLPEQHRIVEEIEKQFTRLDAAVSALKRVQANLRRYRASVLKAACEGRLVSTEAELARAEGSDYEPADRLLERILKERRAKWESYQLGKRKAEGKTPKDEKWKEKYQEPAAPNIKTLPELPEGWKWSMAEQITSLVTDGEHITPRRTKTGILLLSARNVLDGRISLHQVDYIPENEYERISKRLEIEAGDVLLSCSGTVGRSCVAPEKLKFALVRSVAVLRPLFSMGKFLSYALRSIQLQSQIASKKTQTAQANIFQGKIKALIFPLPPLAEQQRIVAEVERRLSVVDEIESAIEINLKRAATLRQSILKRAFEGKLVPQDPNDEPASVLLERIRAERQSKQAEAQKKKTPRKGKPKPADETAKLFS